LTAPASSQGRLLGVLPLLLLWVLIGLVAFHRAGGNDNPEKLDQGAYLHLSLHIHEHRALTDGNRHPLYPSLLAPFASREHAFFATAKLVTLGLGMVGYLFVAWRVARRWGTGFALLVLLACGARYCLSRCFGSSGSRARPDSRGRVCGSLPAARRACAT
jgi:hypothetical protein